MGSRLTVFEAPAEANAARDTALSRTLLSEVAAGRRGASLRLYPAPRALAFSILDRNRPGFAGAVAAAEGMGFEAILRLAGGRAAVFTPGCLAFAWITPEEDARSGIAERFDTLSAWVRDALRELGVDARIGEVPGEYCPGSSSVNARGEVKLMGVGQRVVKGAAHVGGVICVAGAEPMRDVLEPVYRELDYPLRVETVGSVSGEVGDTDLTTVADALKARFATQYELEAGTFDPELLTGARTRESDHRAPGEQSGVLSGAATRKTVSELEKA